MNIGYADYRQSTSRAHCPKNSLQKSNNNHVAKPNSDPLVPYLNKVEPEPGAHVSIEQLRQMAECIELFQDSEEYKNDPRFLRICLDYGAYSESPLTMFNFMDAHGIGNARASFFYHWANFLEGVHQFWKAKLVVMQGLRAYAQPRLLLQQLLEDLELRHPGDEGDHKNERADAKPTLTLKESIYTGNSSSGEESPGDVLQPLKTEFPRHENGRNMSRSKQLSSSPQSLPDIPRRSLQVYQSHDKADEEVEEAGEDSTCAAHANNTEIPRKPARQSSYQHRLLQCRQFSSPVRPFDRNPKPLTVHRHKVVLPSEHQPLTGIKRAMYDHHGGVTEPIASACFAKGDTEVLR